MIMGAALPASYRLHTCLRKSPNALPPFWSASNKSAIALPIAPDTETLRFTTVQSAPLISSSADTFSETLDLFLDPRTFDTTLSSLSCQLSVPTLLILHARPLDSSQPPIP